jgi:Holliday junction resolvase RusA-like endonuclease
MYTFTLDVVPMPTTNRNMIVHPKGKRPMVIKTSKAKRWMDSAVFLIRGFMAQNGVKAIDCPVSLAIDVYRPTASGDIDNYAKGILDALQASGMLTNDSLVNELTMRKHTDRRNPRYQITLTTLKNENARDLELERFPQSDEQYND